MSSKDTKINPDVVVKLMGTIIKNLVDKNTGRGKPVKTNKSLKPLAENKNRRGVVVVKNIKDILEDEKKLTRLRTLTENYLTENKKIKNFELINNVISDIKKDPTILNDDGFSEIYTNRFIGYIQGQEPEPESEPEEQKEGVEKKEEKEREVKEKPKPKPLDETIEKLETKGVLSSRPSTKPSDEKVKVSEPSIAQRTKDEGDEPQIIMTQPQIDDLPTMPVRSDIKRIESSTIFGNIFNYITSSNSFRLFEGEFLNELLDRGVRQIPLRWRRIIEPALEGARTLDPISIGRALTHIAILYFALPSLGVSSKSRLSDLIVEVMSNMGDKFWDGVIDAFAENRKDMDDLIKDVDKEGEKIDKEKIEKPDKPDDKQPEKPDKPDEKQPDDKPLTRRKRIVPSLLKAGLIAGGVAGASKLAYDATKEKPATAEPARPPPRDTLEDVVDLGTSGASAGIGAIALNEIRRQIVEARPETRPYIDSLGAEALTNLLGGILGYKAGEVIKEKTDIKEKIKEDVKQQLGIKETPITYDPKVLEKSTATYAQQETAKNRNWQPKTIMPSTSILDESNQEKYIDDLETSAFDYIAPTSEGSAGTIYTNPLKRQQFINERIRLEGAGMYLPYKTWGVINDPNEMSQEQLKLMLLGPKLPELQFEPMDNATSFENVQTVHLVNNEQNSIEMFSPYSQFSNVDNNWWTNEKSVLYTINP